MRNLLILFLLASPYLVYSQKTKKVKNSRTGETYYVLKSKPTIMHGPYNTKYIEGTYENGQRVGEWKFYGFGGKVVQVYDYTKKQAIIRNNKYPKQEHQIIQNGDTVTTTLDYIAEVLGSETQIMLTLRDNITYPLEAKQRNIEGKVYIEFTVDETGMPKNYRIVKGIGYGCDEEALKAIKLLPEPWLPAEKNGKPVIMVYRIPVEFRLN